MTSNSIWDFMIIYCFLTHPANDTNGPRWPVLSYQMMQSNKRLFHQGASVMHRSCIRPSSSYRSSLRRDSRHTFGMDGFSWLKIRLVHGIRRNPNFLNQDDQTHCAVAPSKFRLPQTFSGLFSDGSLLFRNLEQAAVVDDAPDTLSDFRGMLHHLRVTEVSDLSMTTYR